jgi:hypothetical protein
MVTFRKTVAVGVFLFGSTFLWTMPLFIGPEATGPIWAAAQVLGFLAIIGFMVAAWGIVKAAGWWETVALVSGVVGIAAAIPYAIAAQSLAVGGDPFTLAINIGLHVLGSAMVIAALRVRPAERWIAGRL